MSFLRQSQKRSRLKFLLAANWNRSREPWVCLNGLHVIFELLDPSPPRFTINPPREIYVSSGSMTNLTCEAFGVPAPDIAWYRNGVLVPRKKTSGVKSVSLLILKVVTSAEQGKYWCEARNSFGRKRSLATSLFLTQSMFVISFLLIFKALTSSWWYCVRNK